MPEHVSSPTDPLNPVGGEMTESVIRLRCDRRFPTRWPMFCGLPPEHDGEHRSGGTVWKEARVVNACRHPIGDWLIEGTSTGILTAATCTLCGKTLDENDMDGDGE